MMGKLLGASIPALRALTLMLCLTMLMPCALALGAELDDIVDPDGLATPLPAPTINAPTFGDIDTSDATAGQAVDITKNCKFKLTEGKAAPMVDNKLSTYWRNKKKAKITITLPAGDVAGGLYIEWYKKPSGFSLVEYGVDGKEILTTSSDSLFVGLTTYLPLTSETKKVDLVFPKKNCSISTLRAYSVGTLPSGLQMWQAPASKADLMVLVAHQGEEFLYMGGSIPYYAQVEGKKVQVVYAANGGRARYKEALTGLWAAGLTTYPDFAGFPDKKATKLADVTKSWNKTKLLESLVARIRKYKPEVIVTHDVKGEEGHGAHILIADVIQKAIVQAADESKFPKSAQAYGVWQAKKLYLHLYGDNQITMDWTTAYPELGGESPSDVAKTGFKAHASQQKSFTYQDGGKYDNALFGLAFTTVGPDVDKNDFFENISESGVPTNPNLLLNQQPEDDVTDETDPAYADEPEYNFTDEDDPGFDNVLDSTANAPQPTVVPPTESAPPNNNIALLGTLLGVPVLLGGSAFGFTKGRKYLKKRRRAQRQAQRKQENV